MTPPEREHIVLAYTFELAKCYEQVVKERQLLALANIDSELCAQVAAGLGLPAPEATEILVDIAESPALSQLGSTWPTDGRTIGIVVDPDSEMDGVEEAAAAVKAAGMVPLLVAPHGGTLTNGMTVQRSFGATRSVEFDAVIMTGVPAPAPDAMVGRDSKAGGSSTPDLDPRVALLLQECFRHAKTIGAWGAGKQALEAAGIETDGPGIVVGDGPTEVCAEVHLALASHRAWERFGTKLS